MDRIVLKAKQICFIKFMLKTGCGITSNAKLSQLIQLGDDCSKVHSLTCLFQDSSKCCHILLKINIT